MAFNPSIANGDVDKKLTEFIEGVSKCYDVIGMSVSAVLKDEMVYARGFGYRDLENKKPVNEHTLFGIGSTTKAFTTTILSMLKYVDLLGMPL